MLDSTISAASVLAAPKELWGSLSYQMQFVLDCEQGFLMLDTSYHLIKELARDNSSPPDPPTAVGSGGGEHAEFINIASEIDPAIVTSTGDDSINNIYLSYAGGDGFSDEDIHTDAPMQKY